MDRSAKKEGGPENEGCCNLLEILINISDVISDVANNNNNDNNSCNNNNINNNNINNNNINNNDSSSSNSSSNNNNVERGSTNIKPDNFFDLTKINSNNINSNNCTDDNNINDFNVIDNINVKINDSQHILNNNNNNNYNNNNNNNNNGNELDDTLTTAAGAAAIIFALTSSPTTPTPPILIDAKSYKLKPVESSSSMPIIPPKIDTPKPTASSSPNQSLQTNILHIRTNKNTNIVQPLEKNSNDRFNNASNCPLKKAKVPGRKNRFLEIAKHHYPTLLTRDKSVLSSKQHHHSINKFVETGSKVSSGGRIVPKPSSSNSNNSAGQLDANTPIFIADSNLAPTSLLNDDCSRNSNDNNDEDINCMRNNIAAFMNNNISNSNNTCSVTNVDDTIDKKYLPNISDYNQQQEPHDENSVFQTYFDANVIDFGFPSVISQSDIFQINDGEDDITDLIDFPWEDPLGISDGRHCSESSMKSNAAYNGAGRNFNISSQPSNLQNPPGESNCFIASESQDVIDAGFHAANRVQLDISEYLINTDINLTSSSSSSLPNQLPLPSTSSLPHPPPPTPNKTTTAQQQQLLLLRHQQQQPITLDLTIQGRSLRLPHWSANSDVREIDFCDSVSPYSVFDDDFFGVELTRDGIFDTDIELDGCFNDKNPVDTNQSNEPSVNWFNSADDHLCFMK
ncbi:hypothetical protein HELRODRAFT_173225 [Helobdella robusta]|uniref:Uncharacterized protein n=1 Tax=Helobdella robusta TaxID=6412 RepID=T1F6L2_HELRO|nr:hypothetical protein HELRODRAFT_173225 [Helobdella robusta]ESO03526.1 hypothetical protein HELRODRAFT_173225 [Helobdella robusta]